MTTSCDKNNFYTRLSVWLVEDVESFNTTIQEAIETAEDRREVCVFCASKRRPFSGELYTVDIIRRKHRPNNCFRLMHDLLTQYAGWGLNTVLQYLAPNLWSIWKTENVSLLLVHINLDTCFHEFLQRYDAVLVHVHFLFHKHNTQRVKPHACSTQYRLRYAVFY